MQKRQLWVYAMLILISQTYAIPNLGGTDNVKISCLESEYLHTSKEFCCDKCHPGYKLEEKCPKPGTRSKCVQCENGTYLERSNYNPNCFTCQKCKPYSKQSEPCTTKNNRVCECFSGYYMEIIGLDWKCTPCKKCGPGQIQVGACTGKQNTQCKCEEKYYHVGKNICKPCVECQKECEHLCTSSTKAPNPVRSVNPTSESDILPKILVPVFGCTTVVAVAVFVLYEGIRRWRKRKHPMSSKPSSPASEDQTLFITVPPDTVNESVPFTNQPCEPEQHRKLPDCVPREIKMHEFFYFVLDEVPIGRFKELARRLGVSEQNIDRAEHDHRNSKDAHYQMLKVWSDSGTGGGNNVLPCHRIQMFIETLRDMFLVNCADNIENRFLSQDTSTS